MNESNIQLFAICQITVHIIKEAMPQQIIIQHRIFMNINEKSNRSLLAMAGERSLGTKMPSTNIGSFQPGIRSPLGAKDKEKDASTRRLMMKLTLPRLRKMQALVRGFLTRRIIYPPLLEQYLLAKSLCNAIQSNVVYRESSEIILSNITYLKYDRQSVELVEGQEKVLENEICNRIAERVFRKQIQSIVSLATAEYAKLLTRPKITYGFNLRDPLQLLLFDKINTFVGMNYKEVVREAIQECANQNRQLRIIDQWIEQFQMLRSLYQQIVNQALNQSIGDYIVNNMIERINFQAAEVVARVCYDQVIQDKKVQSYNQIQHKMMEWILQEGSLKAIKDLGHSMNK